MAQEEIIFKVGVDTGDSVQDVNKVGDAIENVGKDAKKTDGSFVNLRKELKQLTIQLQNLDPASKEFETVAKRAGQIKEQMRGVADAINDADPEKFGGKFQRTAEGIAGAFSAVTGAQALFGQQSEEIEKQMLKVQGAIALTQGISAMKELRNDATDLAGSIKNKVVTAFQSLNASQIANAQATGTMTTLQKAYNVVIGTSTGALKGFKLALASTGIGALILALGYLITNFDKLKGSLSAGLTSAKKFETSTTQQGEAARYASDNFAEYERTLRRLGLTEEEISNKRKARFKDAIDKTQKEIEASKEVYKEQLKNLKTVETFDKFGLNATGRLLFGDEEDAKAQQQKIKDLNASLTKLRNDQFEYNQQIKEDRKKDNEDAKNKLKEANDEAVRKEKERREKILEEIHQANLKRIELENERIAEQEKLENEYYDSFKTQQQLEEQAVRDKYFKIIQTTKDNETLKLAQQKELDAIAKKYKDAADKEESNRQNNLADKYEEYYNEYYDATTAAYQKEQDAVNAKYFYLIEKAKEYGLSTVELEKKRQEELDKIQTPEKQALQDFKNLYGELSTAIQTSTEIDLNNLKTKHSGELEMLKDNYGEKQNYAELEYGLKMRQYNEEKAIIDRQRAFAEFQKKVAIVQTTIDTAKSLSSTIAGATQAAAAGGPAAPFLLASYIATGIATVTTAYAKVKTLLNAPMPSIQAPKMPREMKDGGTGDGTQGAQQTVQAQSTYKVVVVDSDITKMQDKTKKVNAISTI